jgi:hypothetical protein
VAGRAVVDGLAPGGQDEDLVGPVNVGLVVGDHHDRAAGVPGAGAVGQAGQELHDVTVELGVQAAGGLVQEQQGGAGEQLDGGGHALLLSARELLDALVHVGGQVQILQDLVNARGALGLGDVLGEAQLSGVVQGLTHGQGAVDDVRLRHHTDLVAHNRVVLVDVEAVEEDLAVLGLLLTGEGLEERGLARARGADDGQELVPAQGEGDLVQQGHTAVVDGEDNVLGHQVTGGASRRLDLDQAIGVNGHEVGAHTQDHGLGDHQAGDAHAPEEDAVGRAQVGDDNALGRGVHPGVVLGDQRVGQGDGVVTSAPDGGGVGDPEGADRGGRALGVADRRHAPGLGPDLRGLR